MVETPTISPVTRLNSKAMADWCDNNTHHLLSRIPSSLSNHRRRTPNIEIKPSSTSLLTVEEIQALAGIFPYTEKLPTVTIIGDADHYYPVDTIYPDTAYPTTSSRNNALDETSIVTSLITRQYGEDNKGTELTGYNIHLCAIPDAVTAELSVKKIIQATALLRGLASTCAIHTLYNVEHYDDQYYNSYKEFWLKFAQATKGLPPMSYYSSMFVRPDQGERINRQQIIAEFGESVAAYILGFTFCKEEDRRLDPFSDRPGVADIIKLFLHEGIK